jgi:hypothetical protein
MDQTSFIQITLVPPVNSSAASTLPHRQTVLNVVPTATPTISPFLGWIWVLALQPATPLNLATDTRARPVQVMDVISSTKFR